MTKSKSFSDLQTACPALFKLPKTKTFAPYSGDPPGLQFHDAVNVLRAFAADTIVDSGWSGVDQVNSYLNAFDIVFHPDNAERLAATIKVDAVMQRLAHRHAKKRITQTPAANDEFPFDGQAALRRRGWAWPRQVTQSGIERVSLKSIEVPAATLHPEADAARATFKPCMWTADGITRQLLPAMFARETILIVLSGEVSIELESDSETENTAFVCNANDGTISRLRLRSSNAEQPWLPAVSITAMSEDASGILVIASEFGVPYTETEKGYVGFMEAPASHELIKYFWRNDFPALIKENACFVQQSIRRRGKLSASCFMPMSEIGIDYPHEAAVRHRDFELLEERLSFSTDVGMRLFLRIVNVSGDRADETVLTRHSGAEIIVPLSGSMHAILGTVDSFQGDFRSIFVDENEKDGNWCKARCEGFELLSHRVNCSLPDVLMIRSSKVAHGFCSSRQNGAARALFVGTDMYQSKSDWFERFYKEAEATEAETPRELVT